jgi:hypothetical protein
LAFRLVMTIKPRVCLSFHALQKRFLCWVKPPTTSLVLGTLADLLREKSELIAENALVRVPLIILHRQIKRPVYRKTDRFLLVLLATMVRTWKQTLFLVQPETLLRGPRELFRLFWKHKSQACSRKLRLSPETISLIKEMAVNNRRLVSGAHPWRVTQAGYSREETDHPKGYATGSRHFEHMDRAGRPFSAIMRQRCRGWGPVISCR